MSAESNDAIKLSFEDLLAEAKKDDPNWELIGAGLEGLGIAEDHLRWALNIGLEDENDNVRDLAISMLNTVDTPLNERDTMRVREAVDNDPYDIIKFRAAIALYNRDSEDVIVESTVKAAVNNPDVGELAKAALAKRAAKQK